MFTELESACQILMCKHSKLCRAAEDNFARNGRRYEGAYQDIQGIAAGSNILFETENDLLVFIATLLKILPRRSFLQSAPRPDIQ